jgi:hypothetical protein
MDSKMTNQRTRAGLNNRRCGIGTNAPLNASLRFRSGVHVLTADDVCPALVNARVAIKPRAARFMPSVRCALPC